MSDIYINFQTKCDTTNHAYDNKLSLLFMPDHINRNLGESSGIMVYYLHVHTSL